MSDTETAIRRSFTWFTFGVDRGPNTWITAMGDYQPVPSGKVDQFHSLLSQEHCRSVLSYFRHHSTEVASIDDLVDFRVRRDGQDESSVRIELHHLTLPKLADVGLVDYDTKSGTVRYRSSPTLERLLDSDIEELERQA